MAVPVSVLRSEADLPTNVLRSEVDLPTNGSVPVHQLGAARFAVGLLKGLALAVGLQRSSVFAAGVLPDHLRVLVFAAGPLAGPNWTVKYGLLPGKHLNGCIFIFVLVGCCVG